MSEPTLEETAAELVRARTEVAFLKDWVSRLENEVARLRRVKPVEALPSLRIDVRSEGDPDYGF